MRRWRPDANMLTATTPATATATPVIADRTARASRPPPRRVANRTPVATTGGSVETRRALRLPDVVVPRAGCQRATRHATTAATATATMKIISVPPPRVR